MALRMLGSASLYKLREALGGCGCMIGNTIVPEATEINYGFCLYSSFTGLPREAEFKEGGPFATLYPS